MNNCYTTIENQNIKIQNTNFKFKFFHAQFVL